MIFASRKRAALVWYNSFPHNPWFADSDKLWAALHSLFFHQSYWKTIKTHYSCKALFKIESPVPEKSVWHIAILKHSGLIFYFLGFGFCRIISFLTSNSAWRLISSALCLLKIKSASLATLTKCSFMVWLSNLRT